MSKEPKKIVVTGEDMMKRLNMTNIEGMRNKARNLGIAPAGGYNWTSEKEASAFESKMKAGKRGAKKAAAAKKPAPKKAAPKKAVKKAPAKKKVVATEQAAA